MLLRTPHVNIVIDVLLYHASLAYKLVSWCGLAIQGNSAGVWLGWVM